MNYKTLLAGVTLPEFNVREREAKIQKTEQELPDCRITGRGILLFKRAAFDAVFNGATAVEVEPVPKPGAAFYSLMLVRATDPTLPRCDKRVAVRMNRATVENPETAEQYAERGVTVRKAFAAESVPLVGLPLKAAAYTACVVIPQGKGFAVVGVLTPAGRAAANDGPTK